MSVSLVMLGGALVVPVLAPAAGAVTPNAAPAAGARKSATRLGFTVSGTAGLSVDVATGNAEFTDQLVTLPGVNSDVSVALAWNSSVVGTSLSSAVTGGTGSGWVITGFDQRLIVNADNSITYYGPGGLTGVFAPSGSAYTSPSQFQGTLATKTGGGWTLTMHGSQNVLTFTAAGRLATAADRNGNLTTFNYDPYGNPSSIVTSRGASTDRTLAIGYSGGHIKTLTQTSGTLTRTVTIGYDQSLNYLNSITDSTAGVTQIAYGNGTTASPSNEIVTLTNPTNATTSVTYTTGVKAAQVAQSNTATGSPGTSTTRLSYPSATQTLVADPTTDQGQAVSAVAHTTYALTTDGTMLVSSATDPDGHAQSATYNPQTNNALTQTSAAGGQSTFTYGANSNESLTQGDSPGGAKGTAAYTNTGQAQYEPNSATNSAGNQLSYTYNGAGNALTSAQGTGPTAQVAYNTLGQATSSASPGAASGIQTTYSYDAAAHNLTGTTPVSGAGLGARSFTHDRFGRLATATDGRGNTITYTYDNADRITNVAYSDANTHAVAYTYDANGRVTQRVDGAGTTTYTYTYDDLGRLLSTSNTAGGGTEAYRYDLAGALLSKTDTSGVTSYTYTAGHRVTQMRYPQGAGTQYTQFGYDSAGRRSDVWMQSDAVHTVWAAHENTTYDKSGRVTAVLGQEGPATSPTTVVSQTACYNTGSAAPTCGTGTTTDQAKIRFIIDHVTGETSTFGYDDHATGQGQTGRLLTVAVTGGSNPRTYTYGYNTAGDRTSAAVTGTSPANQSLSYNNANQISTTGYSYDAAGNRTATPTIAATFNAAAQTTKTTKSGVTSTYTYAGTNSNELLNEATAGGHTYGLVYGRPDQSGLPEIEQVHYDSVTGYIQHDPTTGSPVMLQTSNNVNCLYMFDITGNPIVLSTSFNTTSYALQFDPYGSATQTAGGSNGGTTQNPYSFHAGLQDRATGYIKFGARWYDPATGTWTQQDTYNAPLSPGNANRYLYAGGDPINVADPLGSWTLSLSGCLGYLCVQANVGTDSNGDLTGGGGVGVGTGEDGSGTSAGATASGNNIESGAYASASCAYGNSDVGVTANSSGVSGDSQVGTTSTGECSGFVGYNG